MKWEPVLKSEANGELTNYIIQFREGSGDYRFRDVNNTKSEYKVITGLIPYTTYNVQIKARNSKGFGPLSPVESITTNQTGMFFEQQIQIHCQWWSRPVINIYLCRQLAIITAYH